MTNDFYSHHSVTKFKTDCLPRIADIAEEVGFSVPLCNYSQVEALRIVEAVIETFAIAKIRDGFSDEEGAPSNAVFFFLLSLLPEVTKAQLIEKRSAFTAEMEKLRSML